VVKQLIRSVSAGEARVIAEQMLRYDTVEEIKGYSFARLRDLGLIEVVESLA
jgi:hypothetical protein